MTYPEAVMLRRSSRTFEPVLSEDDSRLIDRILNRLPKRHFGRGMIAVRRIDCPDGVRAPGTYGFIRGARHYLAACTSDAVNALTYIDCGMICELAAIYATSEGLGTCLMTGSLRDSQFARAAGLGVADSLLLASPVGRPRAPRLAETIMALIARSSSRQPMSRRIFSASAMTVPWQAGDGDETLLEALQGLCRAPSAYNRQPWRVVVG
ncbi:MAG: nitroreductase family protein, partial [Muribaculaceae bacterium]|nr:nitroreductase family protein [Muribaculaceae bacterium]